MAYIISLLKQYSEKFFVKPHLFYLALFSFGLSFGSAFQLSNLSSIFKFLGAEAHQLPLLWLAPPVTGLLIQPLIGQITDDTITRYGKRRPYMLAGGILTVISFCFLPFFASLFSAVLFTWMIDASINASTETLRALTSDLSVGQERSKGFALQAFFGGIGAAFGTSLPYVMHKISLLFHSTAPLALNTLPLNLKLSFVITGLVIGVTLFFTLKNVKEKPYKHELLLEKKHAQKSLSLFKKIFKTFKDLGKSIQYSPPSFKKYCMIHAATWLGIFIFWLYFTTVLAQNFYGLPIMIHSHHPPPEYMNILEKATLSSSLYLTVYQYVSVIYTLFLFFLLNRTDKTKLIHAFSVCIGGIGMTSVCFIHSSAGLLIAMAAIGIMWGSVMTMPYIIITQLLPKGKLGTYLGIFNISITIPQIISGLLLSPIYIYLFKGHADYLLFLAGTLIIISAYLWLTESINFSILKTARLFFKTNLKQL